MNNVKGTKEVLKLLKQLGKSANKVLRKELRAVAKEVASEVKADVPVDTGFLRRSITVRAVKSKKVYSIAFRVVAKPPKEGRYYAFAGNYGVAQGLPGHQPAYHFFEKGIDKAEAKLPTTINRIAAALRAEWKKK